MEHDHHYRARMLRAGHAAVFTWDPQQDEHPLQREVTATVRAMVAYLDRVQASRPSYKFPTDPREIILQSFQKEGYGIVPVWDGNPDFLLSLRNLIHRSDLQNLPTPGSPFIPGTTRGRGVAWTADIWASILEQESGFWDRNARHLVLLPWPSLARNRSFDLDGFVEATQETVERDDFRYRRALATVGEPSKVASSIRNPR